MVCSEMVEEEDDDYNWGGIIDPCDESKVLNVEEDLKESHIVVKAEHLKEYEENLINFPIDNQQEQQNFEIENKTDVSDNMTESRSNQTYDHYLSEDDFEMNDVINFKSLMTKYDNFELFE